MQALVIQGFPVPAPCCTGTTANKLQVWPGSNDYDAQNPQKVQLECHYGIRDLIP